MQNDNKSNVVPIRTENNDAPASNTKAASDKFGPDKRWTPNLVAPAYGSVAGNYTAVSNYFLGEHNGSYGERP